jgi:HAMP domain-containing protein
LFAGIYEDRGKIALGVMLIFATLVILSGLLSLGIVRPVEALGEATRAVARGGGSVPAAPTTAAVEIQALYRDFGTMAEAIDRRSRYLRDFAHAVILVRQKPGSAKGILFITIEDETGIANGILWPDRFEAQRRTVMTAAMIGMTRLARSARRHRLGASHHAGCHGPVGRG